jgi:hypothetical protein
VQLACYGLAAAVHLQTAAAAVRHRRLNVVLMPRGVQCACLECMLGSVALGCSCVRTIAELHVLCLHVEYC